MLGEFLVYDNKDSGISYQDWCTDIEGIGHCHLVEHNK